MRGPTPQEEADRYLQILAEVGVLGQLCRAHLERAMAGLVTLPQFTVLDHLARFGDGTPPHDLAGALGVPRPSLTNTLQGLDDRQLIMAASNPRDGRSKRIFLTKAGEEMRARCIERLGPAVAGLAAKITADNAETLLRTLARVRAALEDGRG